METINQPITLPPVELDSNGEIDFESLKTNRKFIGIEKEQDYIKIAKARLKPYLSQEILI